MNNLCVLFVLSCTVACVLSAAAIFPYEPKPPKFANLEGCYLSSLGKVLKYDKPYYPKGKCEEYICKSNNQTQWVSCGVLAVPPNCRIVTDLTKRYPDCCGRPVCDPTTEAPSTELCDK